PRSPRARGTGLDRPVRNYRPWFVTPALARALPHGPKAHFARDEGALFAVERAHEEFAVGGDALRDAGDVVDAHRLAREVIEARKGADGVRDAVLQMLAHAPLERAAEGN